MLCFKAIQFFVPPVKSRKCNIIKTSGKLAHQCFHFVALHIFRNRNVDSYTNVFNFFATADKSRKIQEREYDKCQKL